MANFNKALTKVLKKEGGYVNDSVDKGGETYKGICRKYYPNSNIWELIEKYKNECGGVNAAFKKKLDADKMIAKEVANIYKINYWNPFKLDTVPNQKVAEQIFDDAVNRGVKNASKLCCILLNIPVVTVPNKKLITALQML